MAENNLPSFDEIKQFIIERPWATICEIRDKFNQKGEFSCGYLKEGCKTKMEIYAYGATEQFGPHILEFIKQDYVELDIDPLASLQSDSTRYRGPDEFVPIVISIKTDILGRPIK